MRDFNFRSACLGLIMAFSPAALSAAPAMTGKTCLIRGEVTETSQREVTRHAGWARSWGIARTTRYTDVTIRPFEVSHLEDGIDPSCTGRTQTFQVDGIPPKVGACVSATARFSGDEFRIGTWLAGISVSSCD
jgi:hypothetical protein